MLIAAKPITDSEKLTKGYSFPKTKLSCSIILLLLFIFSLSDAQVLKDTVKIMTYNVLNYGFPATSSCPGLITANKDQYLKTILRYENPDILGLVKMDASPSSFTTNAIVHNVLDSVCLGCYGHSQFTNVSGYTKENMLYFKTAKFGFVSTTVIYSADANISDISLHTLFYKDQNLAVTHDTVFIHVVLVHDKSGSSNASNRAAEIGGAMTWLNSHVSAPGNYFFMGDFNVQSSTEACFQDMINSSNVNTKFYDPVNQLGNWANNPAAFADYLTEDTRMTDPGDCGASGGISTRFVHILCTQPVMQGLNSVAYVPGSYKVIGQDGNHTNLGLTDAPVNTSVPSPVLNALFSMSNHLPVCLKLAVTKSNTTDAASVSSRKINFTIFPNPSSRLIHIKGESLPDEVYKIILRDESGKIAAQNEYKTVNNSADWLFNTAGLGGGVFFMEIVSKNEHQIFKVGLY